MKSFKRKCLLLLVLALALLGVVGCNFMAGVEPQQPESGGAAVVAQPTVPVKVITRVITATPAPSPIPTLMAAAYTPGQLEIHILYVEHGDAQLIISPTGETLLIDVAREEFASRTAEYLRQVLGELAVDYLMLSHYHVDHIQAFSTLMAEGLTVRRAVLDRGGDRDEYDSDHYRRFYDYVSVPANGLRRVRVYPGDVIDMGPALSVDVLAVGDIETRTSAGVPVKHENDNSIALWLTFGNFDYWTGGDLTGAESMLYGNIESGVIPLLPREADVYRVNHHCVELNSNPEFVAALNPTVSLISASTAEVDWNKLLFLEEYGDVYITARIAAHQPSWDIVLTSHDGDTYTVEGKSYTSKE